MSTSNVVAIIPAAGRPTNKILLHTNLPDTMLPINGKPVIGYILDNLLERGIHKSVIALHADDRVTEDYVTKKFSSKLDIHIIRNDDYSRGLGHTIYQAVEVVEPSEQILIYLGDTVYQGPLEFGDDFVIVSDEYEQPNQWCFIEDDGSTQCYVNKPKSYTGPGSVLVGIYFISDTPRFKDTIRSIETEKHMYELYEPLDRYPRQFKTIKAEGWYDCGNIENYYRAKVDFLKTRSFNELTYNDLYGTITKASHKKAKIVDEINWYKTTPKELQIFSPRLVDSVVEADRASYTLEYYGYQSLADYFVFNHFDDRVWKSIIDRLFEITGLFRQHTAPVAFPSFEDMYVTKTLGRISEMTADPVWAKRFSASEIIVNGKTLKGWPQFEKALPTLVKRLFDQTTTSFLHGDLCLGNILFDPHSRIIKCIDPRGSFGVPSIYGDHQYDIAKLRHSFVSRYDFIVGDLFDVEATPTTINFVTHHDSDHERIAQYFDTALTRHGYDSNLIKAIEGLLFISMLPIHSDSPRRQLAMFATGIELLNTIQL